MTESLEEMEARVRAALAAAKTAPRRPVVQAAEHPTRPTLSRHVALLADVSKTQIASVADLCAQADRPTVDEFVDALRESVCAFAAGLSAAETIVSDTKAENRRLAAENRELLEMVSGAEAKRAEQRSTAALVASGVVSMKAVADRYASATVREGATERNVKRDGAAWSCDCGTAGECAHVRAVKLIATKTATNPTVGADAKTLASSGAVWLRMLDTTGENRRALAEVVDNGKMYTVSRVGFGGYSCDCHALNADCRHGDAMRFAIGDQ